MPALQVPPLLDKHDKPHLIAKIPRMIDQAKSASPMLNSNIFPHVSSITYRHRWNQINSYIHPIIYSWLTMFDNKRACIDIHRSTDLPLHDQAARRKRLARSLLGLFGGWWPPQNSHQNTTYILYIYIYIHIYLFICVCIYIYIYPWSCVPYW